MKCQNSFSIMYFTNSIFFQFFLLIVLTFFLFSCQTSKLLDGEYLLQKNVFKFKGKPHFKEESSYYTKQKPNSKIFFFFPLRSWIYNLSNKKFHQSFDEYDLIPPSERSIIKLDSIFKKNNLDYKKGKNYWFQRQFYKLGNKPVIIDSSLIEESKKRILAFYKKKGYYDTKIEYQIKKSGKKKAQVIYEIENKNPVKIKTYDYHIPYQNLLSVYEKYKKNEYIKSKDILDEFKLQKEITRLENLFKNYGFYDINATQEIYFEADTLENSKYISLKLIIKRDTSINLTNRFNKFYFGKINLHDYKNPGNKTDLQPIKTTEFENYTVHTKESKYLLQTLTNLITIESGALYRLKDEITSKRRIYSCNNFDISDFKYTVQDSIIKTDIYLHPKLKYDLDFSTSMQYSELLNFGFTPGVNLKIRNLFGGAENLDIGLQGSFGRLKLDSESKNYLFNASDISLQTKITYPRLLFPYAYLFVPKKYFPSSDFVFGLSKQNNIGLGRINIIAGFNYYLQPNEKITHRINLLNSQYVNIIQEYNFCAVSYNFNQIKNEVLNDYFKYFPEDKIAYKSSLVSDEEIENQIFNSAYWLNLYERNSLLASLFRSMLNRKEINTNSSFNNSIIYEFTYNQKGDFFINHPLYLNLKVEYSGLLLRAIDSIFNLNGKIFDVWYSQFLKFDIDFRKYFNLNSKNQIAFRQFFGITIPFKNTFIPFEKNYFMGGSNDLRAWNPFSLGASLNSFDNNLAFDNLKLFSSLEYRFPFLGDLYGGIFIDAGNIWNVYQQEDDRLEVEDNRNYIFQFKKFINQIAIGSGFGFRYDVKYLVLRCDLAYKAIDPSSSIKKCFNFSKNNIFRPTFNFSINLPF